MTDCRGIVAGKTKLIRLESWPTSKYIVCVTADISDYLSLVNECQITEMQKAGQDLIPDAVGSLEVFSEHVRNVEAALIHTYQITAFVAVREPGPQHAAKHWKEMVRICERALTATKELRDKFPNCRTPELYDLALDYMLEAQKRFHENLQDSECPSPPEGLFPKTP